MADYKRIAVFNAGHGREGTITLCHAKCDVCQEVRQCIAVDGSEGEYDSGKICAQCCQRAFAAG